MTTKSLSLISHPLYINSLSPTVAIVLDRSYAIASKILLTTLSYILLAVATSVSATAEDAIEILDSVPPPPPVAPRNRLVKHKYRTILPVDLDPPTHTTINSRKEYTFSAPKENSEAKTRNIESYKVQVFGDAEGLLERVRDIEPSAFQMGDIIQVGIFSEQSNAEDLVRKLAVAGFWSRIVNDD